jgi:DeoR family fructose operon transcriptional repressor
VNKQELREVKLLEMLKAKSQLDIAEVTATLDVSEATARRLFARLEEDNKLIRVHGGIKAAPELRGDYSFQLSAAQSNEQKEAIGRSAARLVNDNERLFLDAGTTVLKMAEALTLRIRTGELKGITVVTNSLSLLNNLAGECEVILLGGRIRPDRRDVCGPLTRGNLEKFRLEKAFFGVDAVSMDGELMTTDSETAETNSMFIQRSKEAIVLADSEKIGQNSLVTFAGLEDITTFISDCEPAKLKKKYPRAACRFLCAK